METMISTRGKQVLIIEGHKYTFQKNLAQGNQRWVCYINSCKAYAKTSPSGELYACLLQHNHEPLGDSELNWERLKNTVKDKISMGENIDEVVKNLPEEISHDEVQRLRRYAHDWRRQTSKSRPDTTVPSTEKTVESVGGIEEHFLNSDSERLDQNTFYY